MYDAAGPIKSVHKKGMIHEFPPASAQETSSFPLSLKSRLLAPMLTVNDPVGTTQFCRLESQ